jgi:hypothetical protein
LRIHAVSRSSADVVGWLIAGVSLAIGLTACQPVRGEIANGTHDEIDLTVIGADRKPLSFGSIADNSALTILYKPDRIVEIDYRIGDRLVCHLDANALKAAAGTGPHGIWSLNLKRC